MKKEKDLRKFCIAQPPLSIKEQIASNSDKIGYGKFEQ